MPHEITYRRQSNPEPFAEVTIEPHVMALYLTGLLRAHAVQCGWTEEDLGRDFDGVAAEIVSVLAKPT